ncbi:MAG: hypothetical protein JW795_08240 [Chitinivibrionales bacterium]|nr:hypothetical protein [Chitinivibrionales bacterium]
MRNFLIVRCLFVVLGSSALSASTITDTLIVGNGTAGPYQLGTSFIDTATVQVRYADSTQGTPPSFIYIDKLNSILFSDTITSGQALIVHFRTMYSGVPKLSYLYKRKIFSLADSSQKSTLLLDTAKRKNPDENLTVSGYKSIGLSFGNQGQLNVNQALEVKIFGSIQKNTTLSGNISDQAISFEDETREVSDIDRMYLSLDNPTYSIVAGDQFVSMLSGALLNGQKKIKGISLSTSSNYGSAQLFGALSAGLFTVQTIRAKLGVQGPYYLTGNGEADLIMPIKGTVDVSLNGKRLTEGETHDYIIDYTLGTLRFSPKLPLSDDQIIQAAYEYKLFNYQRTFAGTKMDVHNKDSTLLARGVVWFETDNKEQPLDLNLDKEMIENLIKAGDGKTLVPNGRIINPLSVAQQNAINRLYKTRHVPGDTTAFFYEFFPFNEEKPLENKDFYLVWFRFIGLGGDYIRYTQKDSALIATLSSPLARKILADTAAYPSDIRGPVYVYVGPHKGLYTAYSPIATPQSATSAEVTCSFRPNHWTAVQTDIVGQYSDKNLFSKRDDNDNTAAAATSRLSLGNDVLSHRGLSLTLDHQLSSARFTGSVISPMEKMVIWDIEPGFLSGRQQAWNLTAGATVIPFFTHHISAGQFRHHNMIVTNRFRYGIQAAAGMFSDMGATAIVLHHPATHQLVSVDSARVKADFSSFTATCWLDDRWYTTTAPFLPGRGAIGSGVEFIIKPWLLSESIYYAQHRKGGQFSFDVVNAASTDTGSTLILRQMFHATPIDGWIVESTGSYQRQQTKKSALLAPVTTSSALFTLTSTATAFSQSLTTDLTYTLNAENGSAVVQIPIFVGKGQGTHSFDTLSGTYVPDALGDYLIEEHQIFDSQNGMSLRKSTLHGSWYFKPNSKNLTGILADIGWSGSLHIEEHIRPDTTVAKNNPRLDQTWIPGLSSLKGLYVKRIPFADLSLQQDIDWRPSFERSIHAVFSLKPSYKKNVTTQNSGQEYGLTLDKNWNRWQTGIEYRHQTLVRTDVGSQAPVRIQDGAGNLQQRFFLTTYGGLSIFATETAGSMKKNAQSGSYYQFQPGISLQKASQGWVQLSYTWSSVRFPGILEFPMAHGFTTGISQVIDCLIDIKASKNLVIEASYRGQRDDKLNSSWLHVVSTNVKASL